MPSDNNAANPTSRRGRKVTKPATEPASRQESEAGGVPLPPNDEGSSKIERASGSTRRRRPRKLIGQAKAQDAAPSNQPEPLLPPQNPAEINEEVAALKSKVQEIESQVQEILTRPPPGPTKSARRRQRKGQASPSPGPTDDRKVGGKDEAATESPEAQLELERLQKELSNAQTELIGLRARKAQTSSTTDEEGVEDIPRIDGPGLVEVRRPRPLGRAVTLSGSYNIPVPVEVSTADLEAIGKGIRSAQSIAKSFLDSRPVRPAPSPSQGAGSSWSEWFGGYSMSIARAVEGMQISSNLEMMPVKPAIEGRVEELPPRRKPAKLERRGKNPERRLSETQVAGLLA